MAGVPSNLLGLCNAHWNFRPANVAAEALRGSPDIGRVKLLNIIGFAGTGMIKTKTFSLVQAPRASTRPLIKQGLLSGEPEPCFAAKILSKAL
jgi:hypothetical protein